MNEETEMERLSRECMEMYVDLKARDLIDGTYEEWLRAATQQAADKIAADMAAAAMKKAAVIETAVGIAFKK